MAPTAASALDWAFAVLPFTALITYIVTIIGCNLVLNYVPGQGNLLQISHLGSGSSNIYLTVGLILIVPQIIAIIIGRLLFLLQTQGFINGIILHTSHLVTLIPFIFLFIVGLVGSSHHSTTGSLITYGIFGSLALYCIIQTGIVFYLYFRKTVGSQYTNVYLPIWFLIFTLVLIAFFVIWLQMNSAVYGYIAATAPFLYFLGFVPQFLARAKSRKRYGAVASSVQKTFHRATK